MNKDMCVACDDGILNIRVGAIIMKDRKIMMGGTDRDYLYSVGGRVKFGETAEEAIKREVLEETGLVISKLKYLFSRPNIYPYSGLAIHTMDLFFLCEVENDSVVIPQDDVSACYWANMNELDLNDFAFESIRSGIKYLTDYKERDGNH